MKTQLLTIIAIMILMGMPFSVHANQAQNEDNNFGLYGFTLDKDLEQTLINAKERGFEIKTFKTPENAKDINLIVNMAQSKNINIEVENCTNKELDDYIFKYYLTRMGYMEVRKRFFQELTDELKITFIPINYHIENKVFIKTLFYMDQQKNFIHM